MSRSMGESEATREGDTRSIGSAAGSGIDWADVHRVADLQACRARYQSDPRRYEWLALGRGLELRLGLTASVFEGLRPEVDPVLLPPATVFMLGAVDGTPAGCLGHVTAEPSSRTLGGPVVSQSERRIDGSASLVDSLVQGLVESVRPLTPDVAVPRVRIVSPLDGVGDSHALAVGIAAIHALVGARVPDGTAATGGYDVARGCFTPVPVETLVTKAAAAHRWGVRRVLVVEGQEIPEAARHDGLEWSSIGADPSSLTLQVLALAGGNGEEAMRDETMIESLRLSLAVHDMQVLQAIGTPMETVFKVTEPFLAEPDAQAQAPATAVDPILAFLAADIRSRMLLHAGATAESAAWHRRASVHLGQGDLPPGMLGDHLLYQHPAHASVLALDLGILENETPGGEAHRRLDAVIEDLESRWCTRHQVLLRLFARNTRWRRRLHLARWHLEPERLVEAEADLLAEQSRWDELLSTHATERLGMRNSRISRQWNYLIEQVATEVALADPERFSRRRGGVPEFAAERIAAHPGLEVELRRRAMDPGGLSDFDLRGLLQGWWLLGDYEAEKIDLVLGAVPNHRTVGRSSLRWMEWLWRFGDSVHPSVATSLAAEIRRHQAGPGGGIGRLLALRRAAMLDQTGGDRSWFDSVASPEGPESLVTAFEGLRAKPVAVLARSPY